MPRINTALDVTWTQGKKTAKEDLGKGYRVDKEMDAATFAYTAGTCWHI